jgi:hypothetical protein
MRRRRFIGVYRLPGAPANALCCLRGSGILPPAAGTPPLDASPGPRRVPWFEEVHGAEAPDDVWDPRRGDLSGEGRAGGEGKAKVLYEGPEPGTLIQHFKDDATAFNAKKHEA